MKRIMGKIFCPEVMKALVQKGRLNFDIGRRVLEKGMKLEMIRKVNVYEMADAIWGSFVGITQLERYLYEVPTKRMNYIKKPLR
ncbi:MAG: hypothetical protein M0R18_09270 [Deltaproteobacteria bacterium]|nr:hypothetical protein [Deltaproteobacteria bacterium]